MISFLRGTVAEKSMSSVVVDVGGIGFECGISSTTAAALPLPGSGEITKVFTSMQVRQDAVLLFGFATPDERLAFERLISISGVGPKLALSVLSTYNPDELRSVVASGDESRMAAVSGVGKKTAQRMLMELRDKYKNELVGASASAQGGQGGGSSAIDSAASALLSMGFSPQETQVALRGYEGAPDDSDEAVEAAIKYALKRLGSKS
jgi:Holliday junction DNA helicase RuvA